ncbi:heavy-metal-associated domain-containing protein [Edaphobacter modestus]|uniref:Heavy-metal-associated domain-containing protein n=1 Tax=Edaphobacter modestus TaxID=388466 RepID=A0A4Q7YW89_9BACT|nr:heavy metal-associated domain-containing protein [Edaphobacter modestus]RZU41309.1 heavy-metal-associated domain-containing protein [Edaphobacter modestus]
MKKIFALGFLAFSAIAAHAEYEQVYLTVFGMDCAPCAHAIHVSMKGIQGVSTVDVDLNTGLVSIKLAPGNNAAMRQFNEAVEKNGFTHKDANLIVRGQLSGSSQAPFLEVTGTKDRYALTPLSAGTDISALLGKTVVVDGTLPQSGKGKVSDTLRYKSVTEAK